MSLTSCRLRLTESPKVQRVRKTVSPYVFRHHRKHRAAFCTLAISTILSVVTLGILALFAGGYLTMVPKPTSAQQTSR